MTAETNQEIFEENMAERVDQYLSHKNDGTINPDIFYALVMEDIYYGDGQSISSYWNDYYADQSLDEDETNMMVADEGAFDSVLDTVYKYLAKRRPFSIPYQALQKKLEDWNMEVFEEDSVITIYMGDPSCFVSKKIGHDIDCMPTLWAHTSLSEDNSITIDHVDVDFAFYDGEVETESPVSQYQLNKIQSHIYQDFLYESYFYNKKKEK